MQATRVTMWIGMSGLFLAACATARPIFEQSFISEYQGMESSHVSPSHNLWMRVAATRYGCDTSSISRAIRTEADYKYDAAPCDIAGSVPPREILAYKTATGIREEWRFGTGSQTVLVRFEGAQPRTLTVSFVQWY